MIKIVCYKILINIILCFCSYSFRDLKEEKMEAKTGSNGGEEVSQQEEGAGSLWQEMQKDGAVGYDECGSMPLLGASGGKEADENSQAVGTDETGHFPMPETGVRREKIKNLADDFVFENGISLEGEKAEIKPGEKRAATVEGDVTEEPEVASSLLTPKRLFSQRSSGNEHGSPDSRDESFREKGADRRGRSRSRVLKELQERIVALENTQAATQRFMDQLAVNFRDLEGKSRSAPADDRMRVISKEQMVNYVAEAIESCNSGIGCSKAYMRKYLLDKYEVPLTPHYMKKMNAAIQVGLEEKRFEFDAKHGLFKQ